MFSLNNDVIQPREDVTGWISVHTRHGRKREHPVSQWEETSLLWKHENYGISWCLNLREKRLQSLFSVSIYTRFFLQRVRLKRSSSHYEPRVYYQTNNLSFNAIFKNISYEYPVTTSTFIPTARQGNVFRSVCQSFCPHGGRGGYW